MPKMHWTVIATAAVATPLSLYIQLLEISLGLNDTKTTISR